MSDDVSEMWRELRKDRQDKKQSNLEYAVEIFSAIPHIKLNYLHWRIGDYDFWPTTGLFLNRKTRKCERGIKNLLNKINKEKINERN